MDIILYIVIGVAAGAVGQRLRRESLGAAGVSMGVGIVGAFAMAFTAGILGLGGAALYALTAMGAAVFVAAYYWFVGWRSSV